MPEHDNKSDLALLWMRFSIVVCFLLGINSVLISFFELFSYLSFLSGKYDPTLHPELYKAFEEIHTSSLPFLAMNLYNIILWGLVILFSIWLLKYYSWSLTVLRRLLGLDMFFTLGLLVYKVQQGTLTVASPGTLIFINALQVTAIIVFAHPLVIELVRLRAEEKKQSR
jgi:hypothetical protein